MTYAIIGSWCAKDGDCDVPEHMKDDALYQAIINKSDDVTVLNKGGAFNGDSIKTMQEGVDEDTVVCLDGLGHDKGETVDLNFDSTGCEEDTVIVDASDFAGDFCMNVTSMQCIDNLYMSNVLTFTAVDANGDPISPTYSADDVYGGGEEGDQNGEDFGDGTYDLEDGGMYEITFLDRNGNEKTLFLRSEIDNDQDATIGIDYIDDDGGCPPDNDPPDAVDDARNTFEDTPVTLNVLNNDTDPDGDDLTVTGVTQPDNGTVTFNENGEVTYTPDDGFLGEDTFTYDISDGNGGVDTAQVTICVHEDPAPPPPPPCPICFADGTEIVVMGGTKLVENLRPGDMVLTKDQGYQPIKWIARRKIGAEEMARGENLRPIRIRAGALGENMPQRDLMVSPQHRMLITGWRCEAMFGESEMLVPAKALVNDNSVTANYESDEVVYVHFMFDQHQIVYANGVESESFHPGNNGLATLNADALEELLMIFPQLEKNIDSFGAPARPVLRTYEARAMMQS